MLALHTAVQSDDYIASLWRDYVSMCCLESLDDFVRLQGTNNNVHHPKWEHKQRWWYLILHWTSQLSTWKRDNKSGCRNRKKSLSGPVSTHCITTLQNLVVMKNDESFSCPMVFKNLSQYLIIICACCFNVFKNPGIILHWSSVVRQIDKEPPYILL